MKIPFTFVPEEPLPDLEEASADSALTELYPLSAIMAAMEQTCIRLKIDHDLALTISSGTLTTLRELRSHG